MVELVNEWIDPGDLIIRSPGPPTKWPFMRMKVGDTFYALNIEREKWNGLRTLVRYYNNKYAGEGRRFVAKVVSVGLKVQRVT